MAFALPVLQFGVEPWSTRWLDSARATLASGIAALAKAGALSVSVLPVFPPILRSDASTAAPHSQAGGRPHVPSAPRQLTLADQWSKVTAVLDRAVAGASSVKDMQSLATQQLDLAQYGLITLVDELSAVMAMPGAGINRRNVGHKVHVFGSNFENAAASGIQGRKEQALAA